MTSNVVWGIDFRAKRRQSELEQLAASIMGEIAYDFDPIAIRHQVDTAPCECLPSGPWTDGAA